MIRLLGEIGRLVALELAFRGFDSAPIESKIAAMRPLRRATSAPQSGRSRSGETMVCMVDAQILSGCRRRPTQQCGEREKCQ
jgi:hypothetical protein